MMLNKLYSFIFEHQLRKNVRILLFQKYSVGEKTNIKVTDKKYWTAEMEKEILNVLNSSTIKNLNRYIDSSLAEQIINDRKAHGPYNSLIELNDKIEYNILSKIYTSIFSRKKKVKKLQKSMVAPDIKTIKVPKSVVGIHVGFESISWTVMTCDHKILDWDYMLWPDKAEKLNTYKLINLVTNTVQRLPSSDCYVLEDFQVKTKLGNIINIQRQFSTALMSCLKIINKQRMSVSNKLSKEDSVYILRPLTTANFFNLRIGNEAIAAEYIINKLLNNIEVEGDTKVHPICISSETKEKFSTKSPECKEQIGWSLLKALTFIHLLEFFNTNMPDVQSIR